MTRHDSQRALTAVEGEMLSLPGEMDAVSAEERASSAQNAAVSERRVGGLYLHIPFCERKCIYCDFYSVETLRSVDKFLDSLKKEIVLSTRLLSDDTEFDTIFFGGGTPSLLSSPQLGSIIEILTRLYPVNSDAEITVETNPGTVDREKLREYRSLGVNRLSVGVQSFHQDELKFLGRIHNADQARECVWNAQEVGFDNVSLDLICSLPGQTVERWESNLRDAVALHPKHISAYSLIVEPRTPLYRMVQSGQVTPLPAEGDADLYELTSEFLEAAGFRQYEVSNHARPGYESRHNSKYWHHNPYLGFGPSAHSFWGVDTGGKRMRWWNIRSLKGYGERLDSGARPTEGEETLDEEALLREQILLGLRSDGIDVRFLQRRFHHDILAVHSHKIQMFIREQLMRFERERLQLTRKGYLVCDAICEILAV